MHMLMSVIVRVIMSVFVRVLMLVSVIVFVLMVMIVIMVAGLAMGMIMGVRFILLVRVGGPFMYPKFNPDHVFASLPLKMHVKIPKVHFGKFPFKGGGRDAQIGECANGHVAADARKTIEIKNFHNVMLRKE